MMKHALTIMLSIAFLLGGITGVVITSFWEGGEVAQSYDDGYIAGHKAGAASKPTRRENDSVR